MGSDESNGRTIIVDLYDLVDETTVAQCGPFATVEDAHAFVREHADKAAIFERLRAGYLPEQGPFVDYLERRAAARAEQAAAATPEGGETDG